MAVSDVSAFLFDAARDAWYNKRENLLAGVFSVDRFGNSQDSLVEYGVASGRIFTAADMIGGVNEHLLKLVEDSLYGLRKPHNQSMCAQARLCPA